ncbi:membrane protein [Methylobacterium haplocladii]|uniref:Membrane protein n=1 Tax=Methylobacterium haplocladii TaxID=1176176 RepID=A0A512IVG3_9HYPH|nr:membrane protein [Methylobacterium haplocladii]GLS61041.1 membrane protein [Methylobacterium haplocladii]
MVQSTSVAPTITPIPEPDPVSPKKRVSARGRLRTYFLTGIIVAGPLAITIYITWWIIALIDGWVKPLVPASYLPDHYLPFSIPGLGLVIAFVAVTLLGFLTANLVGRSVVEFGEVLLARTPVISGLYRGLRQIFETLFSANGTSFRTVGLVEFPVKGTWSVVFLSAPAGVEVQAALPKGDVTAEGTGGHDYVGVFLPCAPNPTTGFFFYLPRSEVIELAISVDDAAKLVMSAGVIQPEDPQGRLQAMAASLRPGQVDAPDNEKARREPARQEA